MDLDALAIQITQHMVVAKAHIERAEGKFVEFEQFIERGKPLLERLEALLPSLEEMVSAHQDARGSDPAPSDATTAAPAEQADEGTAVTGEAEPMVEPQPEAAENPEEHHDDPPAA